MSADKWVSVGDKWVFFVDKWVFFVLEALGVAIRGLPKSWLCRNWPGRLRTSARVELQPQLLSQKVHVILDVC